MGWAGLGTKQNKTIASCREVKIDLTDITPSIAKHNNIEDTKSAIGNEVPFNLMTVIQSFIDGGS